MTLMDSNTNEPAASQFYIHVEWKLVSVSAFYSSGFIQKSPHILQ